MNPAKSGYANESRYERLHGKTAKSGPLRAVTETDHGRPCWCRLITCHSMRCDDGKVSDFFLFFLSLARHTQRDVNDFVGNIKGRVTAEVTV